LDIPASPCRADVIVVLLLRRDVSWLRYGRLYPADRRSEEQHAIVNAASAMQ
jgi:hypothetical protein